MTNIVIKESKQTMHYICILFLVVMFTLCCWFDQKTGISFNGSFSFNIKFGYAQIRYSKVKNSLYHSMIVAASMRSRRPHKKWKYLKLKGKFEFSLEICSKYRLLEPVKVHYSGAFYIIFLLFFILIIFEFNWM